MTSAAPRLLSLSSQFCGWAATQLHPGPAQVGPSRDSRLLNRLRFPPLRLSRLRLRLKEQLQYGAWSSRAGCHAQEGSQKWVKKPHKTLAKNSHTVTSIHFLLTKISHMGKPSVSGLGEIHASIDGKKCTWVVAKHNTISHTHYQLCKLKTNIKDGPVNRISCKLVQTPKCCFKQAKQKLLKNVIKYGTWHDFASIRIGTFSSVFQIRDWIFLHKPLL